MDDRDADRRKADAHSRARRESAASDLTLATDVDHVEAARLLQGLRRSSGPDSVPPSPSHTPTPLDPGTPPATLTRSGSHGVAMMVDGPAYPFPYDGRAGTGALGPDGPAAAPVPGSAFVQRVSQLPPLQPLGPWVRGLHSFYEGSKRSSAVVRLGAGAVEGVGRSVGRLPGVEGVLGTLDDWGVPMIDKLERNYLATPARGSSSSQPPSSAPSSGPSTILDVPSVPLPSAFPPAPSDHLTHPPSPAPGAGPTLPPLTSVLASAPPPRPASAPAPSAVVPSGPTAAWLDAAARRAGAVAAYVGADPREVARYAAAAIGWIQSAIRRLDSHIAALRHALARLADAAETALDSVAGGPSAAKAAAAGVAGSQTEPDPLALAHLARTDLAVLLRRLFDLVGRAAALLPEEARRVARQAVVGAARRWAGHDGASGGAAGGDAHAGAAGAPAADPVVESRRVLEMAMEARGVMEAVGGAFAGAVNGQQPGGAAGQQGGEAPHGTKRRASTDAGDGGGDGAWKGRGGHAPGGGDGDQMDVDGGG